MDKISIRPMLLTDLDAGFLDTLTHLTVVNIDLAKAKQVYKNLPNNHYIFVAFDENITTVIGTASIIIENKFIHGGSSVGHIEDVVVRPSHAKQGIGSTLIEKCIAHASDYNCYKIILNCNSDYESFYIKNGFKQNGLCMRYDFKSH